MATVTVVHSPHALTGSQGGSYGRRECRGCGAGLSRRKISTQAKPPVGETTGKEQQRQLSRGLMQVGQSAGAEVGTDGGDRPRSTTPGSRLPSAPPTGPRKAGQRWFAPQLN